MDVYITFMVLLKCESFSPHNCMEKCIIYEMELGQCWICVDIELLYTGQETAPALGKLNRNHFQCFPST